MPRAAAAAAASGSWRRSRRRLLALDFAESEDRLDAGDLALGLDDLAGRLQPLRLALEAEPEQVVLNLLEQQVQLFIGLLTKFGGLGHCGILRFDFGSDRAC